MIRKIKAFLFTNQTNRQTIAKNTFWLGVSNIGGRLIKAIIIVYAARVLGAAEWGVFSYAVTLTAFLTVFTDFGINSILVRESSKMESAKERAELLSTSFLIKSFLLLFGVLLIIFIAPFLTNIEGVEEILPIVAFILIFDTLREFGFALNKVFEKMEREAGLFILTNVAIVMFGFIFLAIQPTIKSFAYSYALGTGLGMIATAFVLKENIGRIFSDFNKKFVKPILYTAWPFAISGVLGILMINTDILIIGSLGSADDVGLYSAADRIIQILYILPVMLAGSVLPTFSRLAGSDNQKMRSVMEHIIALMLLAAIPISIGGFLFGTEIVTALFGGEYAGAGPSFQVLVLTLMINFPTVILSSAIFAYNRQKALIVNSAVGGGANVVLDLLLIPILGIFGSAIATFLSQIFSNFYLWNKMKAINYFKVWPHLKKVVVATTVMAVFILIMKWLNVGILFGIPTAILIYFGTLFFLKEKLIHELKSVWHSTSQAKP